MLKKIQKDENSISQLMGRKHLRKLILNGNQYNKSLLLKSDRKNHYKCISNMFVGSKPNMYHKVLR